MMRRALLLAAVAEPAFPATIQAAGLALRLHGTATRRYGWLGIPLYDAALYLPDGEARAAADAAAPSPRLVVVRYRYAISAEDVRAAWAATLPVAPPDAFRAWLRGVRPGEEERMLFQSGTVRLEGAGRAPARIPDPAFAQALLDSWVGGTAEPGVRRGLLGA